MKKNSPVVSRRRLLLGALGGAGVFLLAGCEKFFNGMQQNKKVQSVLESAERLNRRMQRLLSGKSRLAQEFGEREISRYFKQNGNPPPFTIEYMTDAKSGWPNWKLEVAGLVGKPASFTLDELKAMPARTQITRHDCVEGWSAIAKWKGAPLSEIAKKVESQPNARYVVFYCMDTDDEGNSFYESIDLRDARHPQTILAYEMNDRPLPVEHGAPLRLRVETQLGYKMAKYIRRIEFVADFKKIAQGKGGYWEDRGYEWYAGI
jgi:DMSO/TMAO reductase YedYZ molybdopterin-dependent catalytic subunit